ncbi:unnamed protein product [Mucor hiemalis]
MESQNIAQFLNLAQQYIKLRDSNAIYIVYQHAVKEYQASMKTFVSWVVTSAVPVWFEGSSYAWEPLSEESSEPLVHYILHYAHNLKKQKNDDMAWLDDNQKSKNTTSEEKNLDQFNQTEFVHWVESTPAFKVLFQLVTESVFLGKPQTTHKRRLEHLTAPQLQQHNKETRKLFGKKFSSLLNPYDYFMLTLSLPGNALSWSDYERNQRKVQNDVQHDLIFSSRRDGMSWQVFVNKMVGQGATLVVIKTKDGAMFGGYADEAWEYAKTDWYGNSSNYLFKLSHDYGTWVGTSANNHYQYLCWGKKSLPNGFGMGGQFEYSGLWIDSDFIHGHSRAGPLCTTYSSPQLSIKDTFIVDEVEVWLVRPIQKDENDESQQGGGVLSHAEDMEFMEMAGKKMYSKNLGPDLNEDNDDSDDE